MGISKVTLDGVTQMDLTQDTVAENNLYANNSAVNAAGDKITGLAQADNEDALLTKTINGVYSNSNITAVRSCAFHRQYGLTEVHLPNVTRLDGSAFYSCVALEEINAPNASLPSTATFSGCTALTSVSLLSTITSIPNYTFANNSSLTNIDFPLIRTVGISAFVNCTGLTSVSFPSTTARVDEWSFAGSNNLTTFIAPRLGSIGNKGFNGCSKLVNLEVPYKVHMGDTVFNNCKALTIFVHNSTALYTSNFQNCINLEIVDMGPRLNIMRPTVFSGCTKFTTFIIRKTSVVPLDNISAFNNSPFASGKSGGTLYVPQSILASYQSATNWSTILAYENNQILPIEGSQYEFYLADGTPLPLPVPEVANLEGYYDGGENGYIEITNGHHFYVQCNKSYGTGPITIERSDGKPFFTIEPYDSITMELPANNTFKSGNSKLEFIDQYNNVWWTIQNSTTRTKTNDTYYHDIYKIRYNLYNNYNQPSDEFDLAIKADGNYIV